MLTIQDQAKDERAVGNGTRLDAQHRPESQPPGTGATSRDQQALGGRDQSSETPFESFCYTRQMRWWRHSALSRAVAFVFLLWTAADLSNASLCALDNEDTSSTAAPSTAGGAVVKDDLSSSLPPVQAPHVDDCFCCSHCVDVFAIIPADAATIANRPRALLMLAAARIFGSPFYHPPQISLQ